MWKEDKEELREEGKEGGKQVMKKGKRQETAIGGGGSGRRGETENISKQGRKKGMNKTEKEGVRKEVGRKRKERGSEGEEKR